MPEDENLLQVIKRQELPVILHPLQERGAREPDAHDYFDWICRTPSHRHGYEIFRAGHPFDTASLANFTYAGDWIQETLPKTAHLYALALVVASWCIRHDIPLSEASMGTLKMRSDPWRHSITTEYSLQTPFGVRSWYLRNTEQPTSLCMIERPDD